VADTKISGLTNGAPASATDVFPIERNSIANFKLTLNDILNLASGNVADGISGLKYSFPSLSIIKTGTSTGYLGIGTDIPSAAVDVFDVSGIQIKSASVAQLKLAGASGTFGSTSLDITQSSTAAAILNRASVKLSVTSASSLALGTSSVERMLISADGTAVTITSPGSTSGQTLSVGAVAATGDCVIKLGSGRTDSGSTYMDLIGDITYTSYGLRIIRGNTGANATSSIIHRGTGDLLISTTEAAPIKLATSGTTALTISSAGVTSLATTPATSDSSTNVATTAFVKNASLGWGQTWRNSGKSAGTNYTNTTGSPIMVCVVQSTGGAIQAYVDTLCVFTCASSNPSYKDSQSNTFIVQPGSVYKVDGNIDRWTELSI